MRNKNGFTIVELLIVVVVIGILAAITIVAYNGIQQRAQTSAAAAFANAALKSISAYKAAEGIYPGTTGCIGTGYDDQTGNGVPDCRWNGTAQSAAVNSSLNTTFEKYTSQSFSPPSWVSQNGSSSMKGGYYSYISNGTLDGVPQLYWFTYAVSGRECPVGPIAKPGAPNWYEFITDNSLKYSEWWTSGSLCWIPLK